MDFNSSLNRVSSELDVRGASRDVRGSPTLECAEWPGEGNIPLQEFASHGSDSCFPNIDCDAASQRTSRRQASVRTLWGQASDNASRGRTSSDWSKGGHSSSNWSSMGHGSEWSIQGQADDRASRGQNSKLSSSSDRYFRVNQMHYDFKTVRHSEERSFWLGLTVVNNAMTQGSVSTL